MNGTAIPGPETSAKSVQVTRTWKQVIYHAPAEPRPAAVPLDAAPRPAFAAEEPPRLDIGPLVRDSRGVTLARADEVDD